MIHNGRRKLPYNPDEALAHLRKADPVLGRLIDRVEAIGGFTLKLGHTGTPFTSLLESILYQQLNGKAAATIHKRVLLLYGSDHLTAIPTPDALLGTPEVHRDVETKSNKSRAKGSSGSKSAGAQKTLRKRAGTAAYIEELIDEQFFAKPKTIASVKAELGNRGHHIPLTSLSGQECPRRLLSTLRSNWGGAR